MYVIANISKKRKLEIDREKMRRILDIESELHPDNSSEADHMLLQKFRAEKNKLEHKLYPESLM